MKNVLLTIAYDGTRYGGWQIQPNAITIEECLIKGFGHIASNSIKIIGSGRTDAGVHATGQRANVHLDTKVPIDRIPFAINPFLPEDIVVTKAIEVNKTFHARYDALNKTYAYRLGFGQFVDPLERNYSYFIKSDINFEILQKGMDLFLGEHDFKGFMATGSSVKSTKRRIYQIGMRQRGTAQRELVIKGSGFLYNMVRIIVGTLIDLGAGKKSLVDIEEGLKTGNRKCAGHTAPPQGLILENVEYGRHII